MNTVKIEQIQEAMQHSLQHTFDKYKNEVGKFPFFQHYFENDHNCKVIKCYSKKQSLRTPTADISYWNELKFNSSHDITMFILKWS